MQTSLENIGQLERRLNVAVPLAQIEDEVGKRLARLARNVKIPGFRPGKVPMKMVVSQYGSQVRSDVISDTVQESLNEAIRDQNLRLAGFPRIEPKTGEAEPGQLEFSAVFEVYPEISVGDLSSVTVVRPVADVQPGDIEDTIQVLRKQRTQHEPVTRAAAAGDRVIVDFTGKIDGVEFPGGQARDFAIVIGEGHMLPEFEAAVTGMTTGEGKDFQLTFPADYHGKDVAGKTADFHLDVKQVAASIPPEVDAEFAKAFGVASGNVDELKAEIEANLKLELKRKIDTRVKEQALTALRQKSEFAVPRALVDQEAQVMAERMTAELKQRGMRPEDVDVTPEMMRDRAEERVALGLVLAEVVRVNNLGARPEQVKALVTEAAQTYEQPEAVVRWHYEKNERLREFEAAAVERNVVDWVLAKVKVEDQPATFTELMGPARS